MSAESDYVTLCMLVHGQEGVGKSWIGQSTPSPRLVLDAEGGSSKIPWRAVKGEGVRQKMIKWDPKKEDPPQPGKWDTCNVIVRSYSDVAEAYAWLESGDHDFASVVLDSVTEIQQRCKDDIGGGSALRIQDWDLMLIRMGQLLRNFRDLTFHKTNPLDAVVFLALSAQMNDKWRPDLQGKLTRALPGYVDLEGYMYVKELDDESLERRLLIQPLEGFAAKDRTHVLSQHYGQEIRNPDIEEMLKVLNDESTEA